MKIFQDIKEVKLQNLVVTIGIFDGVHLGHQRILKEVVEEAKKIKGKSLVITLWPHPKTVLTPDSKSINFITTQEEKYGFINSAGIDAVLVIPFTAEFAEMTAATFIKEIIVDSLAAKRIIIGYNHHFGKNREGNYEKLNESTNKYNYTAKKVTPVTIETHKVSSSAIRKQIENGNIHLANKMLGYSYFITGNIIKGDLLGHKLGYPTANLDISSSMKLLPKNGVYAVTVNLEDKIYNGMANIGIRPTVNKNTKRKFPTHIKGIIYIKNMVIGPNIIP